MKSLLLHLAFFSLALVAHPLSWAQSDTVASSSSTLSPISHSSLPPLSPSPDTLSLSSVAVAPPPASMHSPTLALCLSLLPGAGQVYNHQAWKIPIIYGLFGGIGYFMYTNYSNMLKFRTEYLHRVNNNGERVLEGYTNYPDQNIYNSYQSYNQYFQLTVILAVVVYGLNLVDAYVFGHLFDFQIDDNISLHLAPSASPVFLQGFSTPTPSLSLSLNF